MYAVIKTGGKQYKVEEGDIVRVEKIEAEKGDAVTFDNVLLIGGDEYASRSRRGASSCASAAPRSIPARTWGAGETTPCLP